MHMTYMSIRRYILLVGGRQNMKIFSVVFERTEESSIDIIFRLFWGWNLGHGMGVLYSKSMCGY
jgi:hypothetical protein